jgi:ribosomal RNA-processing protein 12
MLANVFVSQVQLRQNVCHALTNLVEKNNRLIRENIDDTTMMRKYRMTTGQIQQNINLLSTFSPHFLSITFDVFHQTTPQLRSPITECIKAFLSIASPDVFLIISF